MKQSLLITAVAVTVFVSAGIILVMADSDASDSTINDDVILQSDVTCIAQPDKPYDIVVLGDGADACFVVNNIKTTHEALVIDSTPSSKPQLIMITSEWASKNNDVEATINATMDSGNMVSLFKTSVNWEKIEYKISYPVNTPTAFAAKVTDNGVASYSVICQTDSDAIDRLVAWADDHTLTTYDLASNEIPYGQTYESFHDFENVSYGWTNIRTHYYKLTEDNPNYDYYTGWYVTTIDPNDGSFGSGLDVRSEMDGGTMIKQGPNPTEGTSTAEVSLELSRGTDGVSITRGLTWSYSISDVVVMNHSSVHQNILDIDHNIDESKNVGHCTYTVEPGKVIRLNEGESYHGEDSYKSQFCHRILGHYTQYDDMEQTYVISL